MTAVFLATTVLTSLTGFLFPFPKLLPSHVVGVVSLVVLTIALVALYVFRLNKGWRPTYVVAAITALYLNTFVGVVQAFQKFPPLQALAPTQSETPFVIAQAVVFIVFLLLGGLAVRNLRP
jgi:magnesium-transporting ATPase (P-type)